ncbi:MAG: peptidylprolyl isomerase, partial [Bryobacteraceae bacterium]|nr:peptidylprolyl isomerase [Bryobacteraceae bacterium]
MFDLFRRRDKAVRYLLGVLLGLVALSLVVTLIPGFGASGAPREQLVAQIGEEPLTVREVQTTLQSALKGKQIPQEMVQFYVPQLIDQMITERAVAFQAARMGFKITDVELANAIRSMLTQYFPTGDIDQQAYQRFLSSQGLNVTEFEKNVRQNLLLLRLQNIALEGAIVTPSEVESEYRRKNDKIKIEYVKFTPASDLKSKVAVTPEEVKTYYSTQKAQYNTPEKRSFHLLFANEQRIGANFEVPEQELRAAYNSSLDKYRSLERVRARHILIKADDKNKDDLAKAEAKASNLLKQIRGGADFAKLAKENSEDTGSGAKGGEMDWFARGQMVAPFENSAFSMKPNEISNLVKTQFGYHIIQVLEKESAKTKQFDEVKNEIATERKRESVFNRMQQAMDQARAELVKAPQNAQQIAAKHNLGYHKVENQKKGDPLPELGNSAEVDNAVTGLRPNEVSPVFQLGPNALAVTEMIQVSAPRPAELAEVENEIRDKILSQKAQQLADKQMKDATDK